MKKNIALLVNPSSNKALATGANVSGFLRKERIYHQLFAASWPAVLSSFSEVWVVGGDGTLNYFVNNYSTIELPIAIFAGGTGNDFHRCLYRKMPLEEQVKNRLQGFTQKIDAGICNNRIFMNGVGIGFDGKVAADLAKTSKGVQSYFFSVLKNIFSYSEDNYVVSTLNKTITGHAFMLSIMNGSSLGNGFKISPESNLDDGLLNFLMIKTVGKWQRLKHLPLIQKGRHLNLPIVEHHLVNKLLIKTSDAVDAHIDGEHFAASEFSIQMLPGAFTFLT